MLRAHLLAAGLLLAVLFGITTLFSTTFERPMPNPDALTLYGFAACHLPCWAGVVPGETHAEDASTIIVENAAIRDDRFLTSSSQMNFWVDANPDASGLIYYRDDRVGNVRLNVPMPVWYFFEALGTPTCAWQSQTPRGNQSILVVYWTLDETTVGVSIWLGDSQRWRPRSQTQSVWIVLSTTVCDEPDTLPWLGFAPIRRYQNHVVPTAERAASQVSYTSTCCD